MTTLLQAPLPGADHFSQNSIDAPTYPQISYESARQYRPPQSRYSYAEPTPTRYYRPAPTSPYASQPVYTYQATQPSSTSSLSEELCEDDDDDMGFPDFGTPSEEQTSPTESEPNPEPTPVTSAPHDLDLPTKVSDDHAVQVEPTQHVDYLSHEWREEDIWASWSYVVKRRKDIANCTRLENASWRQWMKTKRSLKTVSPESLNWLKDCDVTWLYGPLQVGPRSLTTVTPPPSRMSCSSSFIGNKKSNLKKRPASAVMLERSRSQQSLLQRAGEIIRVQQASSPVGGRPAFHRSSSTFNLPTTTDSSVAATPSDQDNVFTGSRTPYSCSDTPTPAEPKHVLFCEEVKQVRAVESDEDVKEEPEEVVMESDEDDDGGLMMAPARRTKPPTPRSSFSAESKTIVPLPSTTLKYRGDTPEPEVQPQQGMWSRGRKLWPSPSQETLRPSRPSHNFLIDDDPEVSDEPWQPPSSYEAEYEPAPGSGLRRTESGMFMPYDEDEGPPRNSIFGQALNAVNTFKDIAHVVWNVGWYKSTDNS